MATTSSTSIPPKVTIVDSIPTIDISANSVIRKKVTQCLSILRIPTPSTSATTIPNQPKKTSKKGRPKILALRTIHPSAGSKAITIAEIVKRCIADTTTDGNDGGKGIWWQYTKLESKLVELPPRKPVAVKEETIKEDDDKGKSEGKAKQEATTNANKRKQDGPDSRASKRPRLNLSQSRNADAPKSNLKKRRRYQTDGADDDDGVPPHLREDNGLESDDDVPPHLQDATDDMDTDDVPPHLRQSSPDDIPPHLRDSTPGAYSDTKPGFLRDSTPGNEGDGGSDDIPPHLRGSSPFKDRDGSSTPKPMPTQGEDRTLTSSPPALSTETPKQAQEEGREEDSNEDKDSNSSDEDDDGYRRFSYLDIEQLSEKHTKRILEDIDEAERNRKKYRAIAVMTIYLSLEKRGDFEKLYGGQTNAGEKKKEQKEGKLK